MSLLIFNKDTPMGKKEILSLREIVQLLSDRNKIANYYSGKTDSVVSSGTTYCFVIENKIISFLKYSDNTIHLIATHPDYFGRGYAKRLIKTIQKKDGFITTRVDAKNPKGIENLLLKCGFEQQNNGKEWQGKKVVKKKTITSNNSYLRRTN